MNVHVSRFGRAETSRLHATYFKPVIIRQKWGQDDTPNCRLLQMYKVTPPSELQQPTAHLFRIRDLEDYYFFLYRNTMCWRTASTLQTSSDVLRTQKKKIPPTISACHLFLFSTFRFLFSRKEKKIPGQNRPSECHHYWQCVLLSFLGFRHCNTGPSQLTRRTFSKARCNINTGISITVICTWTNNTFRSVLFFRGNSLHN